MRTATSASPSNPFESGDFLAFLSDLQSKTPAHSESMACDDEDEDDDCVCVPLSNYSGILANGCKRRGAYCSRCKTKGTNER